MTWRELLTAVVRWPTAAAVLLLLIVALWIVRNWSQLTAVGWLRQLAVICGLQLPVVALEVLGRAPTREVIWTSVVATLIAAVFAVRPLPWLLKRDRHKEHGRDAHR